MLTVNAQATDEISYRWISESSASAGIVIRGASDDGKRVVFESTGDYTGQNADENTEIFVIDVDSGTIIQLTKTANVTDPADSTKILINIACSSPTISGDGTQIVFLSNAPLTAAPNADGNYEVFRATLPRGSVTPTFVRITNTTSNNSTEVVTGIFNNYQVTTNFDGSIIAFVSTRQVFSALENGTAAFTANNPDQNGQIILYNLNTRTYTQVSFALDADATDQFSVKGFNANPGLSGNGKVLVFLSGFNYVTTNADFNPEIFLYNVGDPMNKFTQVTQTTGLASFPLGAALNVLAAFTRAINFDASWLVFESSGDFVPGKNPGLTREIFLYSIKDKTFRQVTSQPAVLAQNDVNFLPSINAAGTFVTFNSVLNLVPTTPSAVATDNGDGSKELFSYDVVNSTADAPKFRQLTFTAVSSLFADQRSNVFFSYPDNTGRVVTFAPVGATLYPNLPALNEAFQAVIRPVTGQNGAAVTLANAASFDATQIARESIAAGFGTSLSGTTNSSQTIVPPYQIDGVSLSVQGLAARLLFVSPGQINFIMPKGVANADSASFTVNNNGLVSSGKVKLVDAAPGVFTADGGGTGTAAAACGMVVDNVFQFSNQPCAVSTDTTSGFLIIFGTGWRNTTTTVTVGGTSLTPAFSGPQGTFAGLDQINVVLPASLAGKGELDMTVSANSIVSATVKVSVK
jgi:uncharacterized protein (TIGR03437 family)